MISCCVWYLSAWWCGQFRRDLTVDYVKLQLCSRFKLAIAHIELELDGRVMADPLSLSDFPTLAEKGSGVVRVVAEGNGRAEVEEEKEANEEEERDARDLASLNDEDLADDLHHIVRV